MRSNLRFARSAMLAVIPASPIALNFVPFLRFVLNHCDAGATPASPCIARSENRIVWPRLKAGVTGVGGWDRVPPTRGAR